MWFIQPQSIHATFNGADNWAELTVIVKRLVDCTISTHLRWFHRSYQWYLAEHRKFIFCLRTECIYVFVRVPFLPHDDVMKWKHFPRCWVFVGGIRWIPLTKACNGLASLCGFYNADGVSGWVQRAIWGEVHMTIIHIFIMSTLLERHMRLNIKNSN